MLVMRIKKSNNKLMPSVYLTQETKRQCQSFFTKQAKNKIS